MSAYPEMMMAAPHMRLTTADHVEAIGMRLLRISRTLRSSSRHHGRSDPLIEDVEQLAQNLRERVG
jgi:hypothetical protein